MRSRAFIAALALCAFASAARAQDVERITAEQLKELAARGAVVIVDVRNDAIDRKIKGAVHIPYNDLEQRASELPRTRPIVTYCA